MKKLLLGLAVTLLTVSVQAQCWNLPDANIVNVSGNVKNQNYNGNTHFVGSATIDNGTNVNNWDAIIYDGSFVVNPPQNMNHSNIYVNGSAAFGQVHFEGGDTLFINGSATINKIVSNNSEIHKRNVIMLSAGSYVSYKGVDYSSESLIVLQGNDKNEVDILVCGTVLEVKLVNFEIYGHSIIWELGSTDNAQGITVQGSDDAVHWTDVADLPPTATSLPLNKATKLGALAFFLGLGVTKRKWLIIVGLIGMGLMMYSCHKSEVTSPKEQYKYYRLHVFYNNGTDDFSTILFNKH